MKNKTQKSREEILAVYELPHGMDIVVGTVEKTGMQYAGREINIDEIISQREAEVKKETLERVREEVEGAVHCLRSYQYGNSSPDLAKAVADNLERYIKSLEAQEEG